MKTNNLQLKFNLNKLIKIYHIESKKIKLFNSLSSAQEYVKYNSKWRIK